MAKTSKAVQEKQCPLQGTDSKADEKQVSDQEVLERVGVLPMDKEKYQKYLAKEILNTQEELRSLKADARELNDHYKLTKWTWEALMDVLRDECRGKQTNLGVATLYYRKIRQVEITDEDAALAWLQENGHEECYRTLISKVAVCRLLTAGKKVPGTKLVTKSRYYLK